MAFTTWMARTAIRPRRSWQRPSRITTTDVPRTGTAIDGATAKALGGPITARSRRLFTPPGCRWETIARDSVEGSAAAVFGGALRRPAAFGAERRGVAA